MHIIAIDVMGGDHGSSVIVPAAIQSLNLYPNCKFILVGNADRIQAELNKLKAYDASRIVIKHASETVSMGELPSHALRYKKDSAMRVALNHVAHGDAGACVSAGNTGALMSTARYVLKMVDGIDRPAFVTRFPCVVKDEVRVLDLGANIQVTPEHLLQFALMGAVLAQSSGKVIKPTVGLLNVGEEEIKGNELVKAADKLFRSQSVFDYAGYVEGHDIFSGKVDVVVTDGFTGNVALKAVEGAIHLVFKVLKDNFKKNMLTRLMALLVSPVLRRIKKQLGPSNNNGACLIGLKSVVIKSHGSADVNGFVAAIGEAVKQLEKNIPDLIAENIKILQENA